MSAFLVTDTPQSVQDHHRVVVWLGKNHGPLPGKVVAHAQTPEHFLNAALEHVQPGLVEDFECGLSGNQESMRGTAEYLLERYKYASRQAHFDMNTMSWTYKICGLQTIQKVRHLPERICTIDQLADRHRDVACVIIGAGPSLDVDSIDPRRILTIATSRSAILCLKAGWCPDYIIHVDPDPFEDLRNRLIGHPLIQKAKWLLPLQSHQNFVNLPGQTFWFGSRLNPMSLWIAKQVRGQMRIPLILSGGSVSCCAYTIAEFMGCSPICLIGQDLSYRGTDQYGSASEPDSPHNRFSSVYISDADNLFLPGIGGEKVQTTMDYMNYADWFVQQAVGSRRKLINCTVKGVHLPGFEHTPIRKVYERYCREAKPAAPDLPSRPVVRPDVKSALEKSRAVCRQIDADITAGRYPKALDRLTRMSDVDNDGFVITSCTQYESKLMAYFSHLPPDHPKMKRCIKIISAAAQNACELMAAALDKGKINVPPITEETIIHRMNELREINALGS